MLLSSCSVVAANATTTSPIAKTGKITLPPISSFDNLIRATELTNSAYTTAHVSRKNSTISLESSSSSIASPNSQHSFISQQRPSLSFTLPSIKKELTDVLQQQNFTTPNSALTPAATPLPSTLDSFSGVDPKDYNSRPKKQRKKKECLICHNFYANLSTHKSTHLTPENRPHKCHICGHGFARNNDLIRHKKRHWKDEIIMDNINNSSDQNSMEISKNPETKNYNQLKSLHAINGTFKCPFNSSLIKLDMEVYPDKLANLTFETSNCHQTGVFSRCDTYKNHLKALHFEYPPGTKKINRPVVPGKCRHCGKKFPNVDYWLKNHVTKSCGYTYH